MDATSDWIVVAGFPVSPVRLVVAHLHDDALQRYPSCEYVAEGFPQSDARLHRIISEEQTSAGDANLTLRRHRPFDRWSIAGISLMRSQRIAGEPRDFVTRHGFGFGIPGGIACPTTLRSAASFAG